LNQIKAQERFTRKDRAFNGEPRDFEIFFEIGKNARIAEFALTTTSLMVSKSEGFVTFGTIFFFFFAHCFLFFLKNIGYTIFKQKND